MKRRIILATGVLALSAAAAVSGILLSGPAAGATDEPAAPAVEDFVPSEEVPADTAVAFPVDI